MKNDSFLGRAPSLIAWSDAAVVVMEIEGNVRKVDIQIGGRGENIQERERTFHETK